MAAVELMRHRLSVRDLYRMAEVGILEERDRIELIQGELIDRSPMGPLHAAISGLLEEQLLAALGQRAGVRSQKPLHLDEHNELEPDIAVVRRIPDHYRNAHPTAADVY